MLLGNPKDSVWEDWGTLGKIRGFGGIPFKKIQFKVTNRRFGHYNLPRCFFHANQLVETTHGKSNVHYIYSLSKIKMCIQKIDSTQ